ncbi:MAG: hypothetical protein ABJA86_08410 [Nocardioidaceae bacterium]
MSAVVLASLAVAVTSVSRQQRQHRDERRLSDAVAVAASVFVVSSSTHPRGGSVEFFATVRNDGPRRVYVKNLTISQDGLRVVQRKASPSPLVVSGGSVDLGLSIRLDCAMRSTPNRGDLLPGFLTVESQNGHSHRTAVAIRATALTDVAATLCSVGPRLFRELSGPLVQTSVT